MENICSKLFRHFRKFDLFKIDAKIFIDGSSSFSHSLGIFLTISLIFIQIASLVYLGRDMYEKQAPLINQFDQYSASPLEYDIGAPESMFFMGVQNNQGETWYDPQIVDISFQIYQQENFIVNRTSYAAVPCNETHFTDPQVSKLFQNYSKQNLFCPPFPFQMRGFFVQGNYVTMFARINRCKINCQSDKEINEKLNDTLGVLYFTDTIIDQTDGYNPIKNSVRALQVQISQQFPQVYTLFYKKRNVDVDMGIVTESFKTYQSIQIEDVTLEINDQHQLLLVMLKKIRNTEVVRFYYQKLQSIFGECGGIYQIFNLVMMVVFSPVLKYFYRSHVILKIFDIKKQDEREIERNAKIEIQNELLKLGQSEFVNQRRKVANERILGIQDKILNSSSPRLIESVISNQSSLPQNHVQDDKLKKQLN